MAAAGYFETVALARGHPVSVPIGPDTAIARTATDEITIRVSAVGFTSAKDNMLSTSSGKFSTITIPAREFTRSLWSESVSVAGLPGFGGLTAQSDALTFHASLGVKTAVAIVNSNGLIPAVNANNSASTTILAVLAIVVVLACLAIGLHLKFYRRLSLFMTQAWCSMGKCNKITTLIAIQRIYFHSLDRTKSSLRSPNNHALSYSLLISLNQPRN